MLAVAHRHLILFVLFVVAVVDSALSGSLLRKEMGGSLIEIEQNFKWKEILPFEPIGEHIGGLKNEPISILCDSDDESGGLRAALWFPGISKGAGSTRTKTRLLRHFVLILMMMI